MDLKYSKLMDSLWGRDNSYLVFRNYRQMWFYSLMKLLTNHTLLQLCSRFKISHDLDISVRQMATNRLGYLQEV